MIRQPALIRDRVLSEAMRLAQHLHTAIATYYPDETGVLKVLDRDRADGAMAAAIANLVMERFGSKPVTVKDPRFDKTRRAAIAKRDKPPRGANTFDSGRERKRAAAAKSPQPAGVDE